MPHPELDTLSQWIIGSLGPDNSSAVAAHVENCSQCEDTVNKLEAEKPTSIEFVREAGTIMAMDASKQHHEFTARQHAPEQLGPYRLLGELGRGGMGTVYLAVHERLVREVAIKILPPHRMSDSDSVARFHREMKAVGRVDHPNIVRATDAGEIDGTLFLVMECVDGEDLSRIQRHQGLLCVADACEIVRQAAMGLEEASAHGMIHLDIKPSNLMLARSRSGPATVKVLDLGLARIGNEEHQELTSTGQIMGSIDYMSPEQFDNTHTVDIRSDIYSLGATLYRLLTGRTPLGGDIEMTPLQKMSAMATKTPRPIGQYRTDLPSGLGSLIDRMLAKDPSDRPASATEVVCEISAFTDGHDLDALLEFDSKITPLASETLTRAHYANTFSHVDVNPVSETAASALPAATHQVSDPMAPVPVAQVKPATLAVKFSRRPGPLVATGLLIASFVAIAIVFMLRTEDGGYVRFEVNDPSLKIAFADHTYTIDDAGKEYRIAEGEHQLRITHGEMQFTTAEFRLGDGEHARLKVSYENDVVKLHHDGNTQTLLPIESSPEAATTADKPADPAGKLDDSPGTGKDGMIVGAGSFDMPVDFAPGDPPAIVFSSKLPGDALQPQADVVVESVTYGMFLDKSVTLEVWIRRDPKNLPSWRFMGISDFVLMPSAGDHGRPVDVRWEGGSIGSQLSHQDVVEGWHHLAGVRDQEKREHRFYVNGKLMGRAPFDGEPQMIPETHTDPLILAHGYTGLLGPARVSASARYENNFVPAERFQPDDDAVAIYNLDDTSNSKVLVDSSGHEHHGRILAGRYFNATTSSDSQPASR